MKHGVAPKTLLFLGGIIWVIAGVNVLRIGIDCWLSTPEFFWIWKTLGALVVFLIFFCFIFNKMYVKHKGRISKKEGKSCPFAFFDLKSWIIMVAMISIGVLGRTLHWFPPIFISIFYTGLSVALAITGVRFLIYWVQQLRK